jgi:hypothetical protein
MVMMLTMMARQHRASRGKGTFREPSSAAAASMPFRVLSPIRINIQKRNVPRTFLPRPTQSNTIYAAWLRYMINGHERNVPRTFLGSRRLDALPGTEPACRLRPQPIDQRGQGV